MGPLKTQKDSADFKSLLDSAFSVSVLVNKNSELYATKCLASCLACCVFYLGPMTRASPTSHPDATYSRVTTKHIPGAMSVEMVPSSTATFTPGIKPASVDTHLSDGTRCFHKPCFFSETLPSTYHPLRLEISCWNSARRREVIVIRTHAICSSLIARCFHDTSFSFFVRH